jgi:hypothetical protein
MLAVAVALVLGVAGVALAGRVQPRGGQGRWARLRRAVAGDVRDALAHRRAMPAIALASAVVVAGHAATFVIAARTAGVSAPATRLLPLAMLAMLAMVLPSVAGWGPREGATAWVFAAAGLGAGRGVATAVAYGIMVLVASLPGALVLAGAWAPRPRGAVALRAQIDGRPDG